MGQFHRIEDHVIAPYQDRTAQQIIAGLETELSVLKIQEPTLEDCSSNASLDPTITRILPMLYVAFLKACY